MAATLDYQSKQNAPSLLRDLIATPGRISVLVAGANALLIWGSVAAARAGHAVGDHFAAVLWLSAATAIAGTVIALCGLPGRYGASYSAVAGLFLNLIVGASPYIAFVLFFFFGDWCC